MNALSAAPRLCARRGDLLLIGGTRILLSGICLAFCIWAQNALHPLLKEPVIAGWLTGTDVFLPCVLLLMMLIQLPLHIQTDRQLGELTGTLDGSDIGFLRLSRMPWLWARAAAARLLAGIAGLLAWLPALALFAAARCVFLSAAPDTESLPLLLIVLHLLLLSAAAVFFPLRVYAASAALPLCFLKNPHKSAFFVLHDACRRTKHRTFHILTRRLLYLPLILLLPVGVVMLPRLLAAEMQESAAHPCGRATA